MIKNEIDLYSKKEFNPELVTSVRIFTESPFFSKKLNFIADEVLNNGSLTEVKTMVTKNFIDNKMSIVNDTVSQVWELKTNTPKKIWKLEINENSNRLLLGSHSYSYSIKKAPR